MRCVLKILLIMTLAGCSTVPLASLPKLARIDFMTTDLARLRIAVALPLGLAPKPGGVVMQMKYSIGNAAEKTEQLHLVQSSSVADKQGLPTPSSANEAVYVFQLSETDVVKLNGLRASANEAKAKHEKGSLSFGIEAKEFCKLADLPAGPAITTTSVLTSENDGYVTLSRGFDLRSDATIAEKLAHLEPCH